MTNLLPTVIDLEQLVTWIGLVILAGGAACALGWVIAASVRSATATVFTAPAGPVLSSGGGQGEDPLRLGGRDEGAPRPRRHGLLATMPLQERDHVRGPVLVGKGAKR